MNPIGLPRGRVLLTSRSGQLGGMEFRLADEARFLAAHGNDCLLAPSAFPDRNPWLRNLLGECASFRRFEFNPPPFFEEWGWRRLNLALARTFWLPRLKWARADLAHIFYSWTQEGGGRLWLCHRAGIPCVLSVHNAFPPAQFGQWHDRLTAESFASVRGLYAVSQSAMDQFLASYGKYVRTGTVVSVVPNFVDIGRFLPSQATRHETRAELGIPAAAKVIGSIGRIDTQKQPLQALEVFKHLWSVRQDIYLVFCGRGPLEDAVRNEAAQYPWSNRVLFTGFRADVERVFPALDVHLLLSKQEGFGISTAEAMACGLPVVATNVPGSRDVIGDSSAGRLVPYGDATAAAQAVNDYLEDAVMYAAAATQGRERAKLQFSKSIWTSRLTEFYGAVMSPEHTERLKEK